MIESFIDKLKEKFKDKYTKRGTVYSSLGLLGIAIELIFRQPAELLVILFYSALVGVGLIFIFYVQEQV
jgi:hypothetical protein